MIRAAPAARSTRCPVVARRPRSPRIESEAEGLSNLSTALFRARVGEIATSFGGLHEPAMLELSGTGRIKYEMGHFRFPQNRGSHGLYCPQSSVRRPAAGATDFGRGAGRVDDFRQPQHGACESRRRDAAQRPGTDCRRRRQFGQLLKSAEIFDLLTNSFTTLPSGLATGVSGLTATVLNDNTVLLAGGLNGANKSVAAAELYDPVSGEFLELPAMKRARSHHTATLLADGRVLIAAQSATRHSPTSRFSIRPRAPSR